MIWLLRILVAALPLYIIRFGVAGVPTTLFEVGIYVLFIWWLATRPSWKKVQEIWRPLFIPLVLLGIGVLGGVAVSPLKREAFGYAKGFFVDPLLLALVVSSVVTATPERRTLGWWFAGGAFAVIIAALASWLTGHLTTDGRLVGIFTQPNYLGMYLIGFLPLLLLGPHNKIRLVNVVMTALGFLVVFGTRSRGALIAAAAALVAPFIWQRIKKAPLWGTVGATLGLAAIIGAAWIVVGSRAETSDHLRVAIWNITGQLIAAHPLQGIGLAAYQHVFTDYTANLVNYTAYIAPVALTPHNLFLMFWVETGLAGLVGFIWITILVGKRLFGSPERAWNTALVGMLVGILVYGAVDTPYFKNDLAAIWWIMSAYALTARSTL